MSLKKFGIALLVIFYLLPIQKIFAQTTNAGFIPGSIWYSEDPFTEGDKIKIYTLIFNPDTRKFSGTVDFFDNSTLLGTKNFTVAATSTEDIFINWTVTAGNHEIYGQIENAKFLTSNGTYVDASLAQNETGKSSRTVTSKVVAQNISNGINTVDGAFNTAVNSIQNIGSTTKNVVPVAISQTLANTTNTLDGLRNNISTTLGDAQTQTQNNLDALDNVKNPPTNSNGSSIFQKPFYVVELFFLTILSYIFKYKILFYGLLVMVILVILRFLWNLIF
ncbi:MAG: hypothetical protein P4L63_03580 [Candidatus Pacebacteria bacterium]|nr:hypothetical protein [Candidatus Paceibacterota bacterium]